MFKVLHNAIWGYLILLHEQDTIGLDSSAIWNKSSVCSPEGLHAVKQIKIFSSYDIKCPSGAKFRADLLKEQFYDQPTF